MAHFLKNRQRLWHSWQSGRFVASAYRDLQFESNHRHFYKSLTIFCLVTEKTKIMIKRSVKIHLKNDQSPALVFDTRLSMSKYVYIP